MLMISKILQAFKIYLVYIIHAPYKVL